MKTRLFEICNEKSIDWPTWIKSYDKFIGYNLRDKDEKIFQYKDYPDYCIWEQDDENIYTISYRYVNHINLLGDMYCLQHFEQEKLNALLNYQKIYNSSNQNIFPKLVSFEVENNFIFSHFVSPKNVLGYPPPYNLFKIMMTSNNVIEDFNNYITKIVDNYFLLWKTCKELSLPFYKPSHLLVNHFADKDIWYFKDSTFFHAEQNTVDNLATSWFYTIDGFSRAQGIIDAYSNRFDSNVETTNKIFDEITKLKYYARDKCLSLKNVDL
jgi:hypothetical protein